MYSRKPKFCGKTLQKPQKKKDYHHYRINRFPKKQQRIRKEEVGREKTKRKTKFFRLYKEDSKEVKHRGLKEEIVKRHSSRR